MANRVIKDSIWTSPTVASMSDFAQDQFPRWLLMADDWGCFNADARVIKGLCYPLRDSITVKKIEVLKKEYFESEILFLWKENGREWGYFVSWDSHHDYCNKTNADNDGKHQKHRRKTPEPPEDILSKYLEGDFRNFERLGATLEQVSTSPDKILNPNPNPNPNPSILKSDWKKSQSDGANGFRKEAKEILDFLNAKTGRSYRFVEANVGLIIARLKSGVTVANCRGVIARKCTQWQGDEKMEKYLRPATLFNKTKFEQYLGEREAPCNADPAV